MDTRLLNGMNRTYETLPSFPSTIRVVHGGAWRRSPPPLALSEESLRQAASRLLQTGSGGLVWRRLRDSKLKSTRIGREYQQAYRLNVLSAAHMEDSLQRAFAVLRAAQVEPILLKGWSVARLYPETGLRPYGDHDLAVAPGRLGEALDVLSAIPGGFPEIDLHDGIPDLPGRSWAEVFARSRCESLGDWTVRVLGAEDQLALLAFHFIRHGAWPPLWLCDIAALVESLPESFDWDSISSDPSLASAWTIPVIRLAEQLLGARAPSLPANSEPPLPWLASAVLWRWGVGKERLPMAHYLRRPAEILRTCAYQWLDPLKVTVRLGIKPQRSLFLMHLLSLWGRPLLGIARLKRRAERIRDRQTLLPCEIHRSNAY